MIHKFIGVKTVVSVDPGSYQRFTEALNEQRDKRIAQEFLHAAIECYRAVEDEMQKMMAADKQGTPLDKERFAKMVAVKEKYLQTMYALREDEDKARHAMIVFADALQDLMIHLHRQRKQ